jgi:hypothetical protein
MRRLMLAVFFLTLSFAIEVLAQDSEVIYLYLHAPENLQSEVNKFIENMNNELAEEDYTLEVATKNADANLAITFAVDENDNVIFILQPLTPLELPNSSVLYAHLSQPFTYIIADWNHDLEALVALSSGIALYSVQEWHLAGEKLNYAENAVSIDTSEQDVFIAFYEGNCYVATSEYERAVYEYFASVIGVEFIPLYVNSAWALLQLDTEWASRYGENRDFYLENNFGVLGQVRSYNNTTNEQSLEILTRRAQLYALAFDYDSAIADMDAAIELAEANDADNELLAELYTLRSEIVTQHLNNQNQELQQIVYIHNSSGTTNPDYADSFLTDIQMRLQAYNVEVRFETDENTQQIIILALFNDSIRVDAQSRPNHRLPVTPIIYPNSRLPYCCQTNPFAVMEPFTVNEESLPIIEDLVVGIALYQAGFYSESYQILDPLGDELLPFYELLPLGLRRFINFYQANNLIMLGDYEAAINRLENTIFEDDINGKIEIINLAWLYIAINRTDDGLNLLNDRLNITPELVQNSIYTDNWINIYEILPRRAQLYALTFDYDSAIADMDAAIEIAEANDVSNEQLAELYTLRGEIIFLIYEWDRVLENFNTALELDPDYAPAYFQRGVLYYTMTERENALADFQHYLELDPDGQYAEQAQQYIDSIQLELDALGG